MADCDICQKIVAVSLYVRVKPVWDKHGPRWRAKKDQHKFFGYWPPDSHLANYFREQLAYGEKYFQDLFMNNCRGHTVDEIIEAIEQKVPPIPGMPIRMLWNPGSKVTPFLLMESWRQKAEAQLDINNDLRTVTVDKIENVRTGLVDLFNNAIVRPEQSISYPGKAVLKH